MTRCPNGVGLLCLIAVVLAVGSVAPASAQVTTIINQTSCIPGTGSCLTNNFLQDLTVDCAAAGSAGRLSTALASLADRSGPNRISISGACSVEVTNIVGFDRLTIQGNPGSSILRGWNIVDSRLITLKSLTFTLSSN